MKIQCDVCERAEAALLCCADEAALCLSCDEKIHAANKLASKHQRLPLFNSSSQFPSPKCDICQDKTGYFFCLEDRALLCRQCDVSIHTAIPCVTSHQRFLVTGVKVGLHQYSPSSTAATSTDASKSSISSSSTFSAAAIRQEQLRQQPEKKCRRNVDSQDAITAASMSYSVESGGSNVAHFRQHWPLDEILAGGPEFDHGYIFPELGSSRDTDQ
ncbi:B-box zinc finger protein 23-like [Aristolochia californica]|uniref:B-box zinc finger protein 23-like n=1 Tax=Aristolochia californica TaxID=171875 RepID=UPI0035DB1A2A